MEQTFVWGGSNETSSLFNSAFAEFLKLANDEENKDIATFEETLQNCLSLIFHYRGEDGVDDAKKILLKKQPEEYDFREEYGSEEPDDKSFLVKNVVETFNKRIYLLPENLRYGLDGFFDL